MDRTQREVPVLHRLGGIHEFRTGCRKRELQDEFSAVRFAFRRRKLLVSRVPLFQVHHVVLQTGREAGKQPDEQRAAEIDVLRLPPVARPTFTPRRLHGWGSPWTSWRFGSFGISRGLHLL